jgi:hypothetical protein
LKDSGFVATSSILSGWNVSLKGEDESNSSVRWKLMYRGSLFWFGARDFHQACDGVGKFLVVVRAENGRIAAAYNEDEFSSEGGLSDNQNGFIVSIKDDGSCGERFDRNTRGDRILNLASHGPLFGDCEDLFISSNCDENDKSVSDLGRSYGAGPEGNETTLFGQEYFRVSDYEVFKIVIE